MACISALAAAMAGCSCTRDKSDSVSIPDTHADQLEPLPSFGGLKGLAFGMSLSQVRDKSPVTIAKESPSDQKRWTSVFRGWDVTTWTAEKYPIYKNKLGRVHFIFLDSRLACVVGELGHISPSEYFDWVAQIQAATGDAKSEIEKYGPEFELNTAAYASSESHKPFSLLFAKGVLNYRTIYDEVQKKSISEILCIDASIRKHHWDAVYSDLFNGVDIYTK